MLQHFSVELLLLLLQAWHHLQTCQGQRRQSVLAARHQSDLGHLRRCLHAWREQCGRHEWQSQVLCRALVLLQRQLMARCWREWRRQCWLRWWKVQLELRDQQIQLLGIQASQGSSRVLGGALPGLVAATHTYGIDKVQPSANAHFACSCGTWRAGRCATWHASACVPGWQPGGGRLSTSRQSGPCWQQHRGMLPAQQRCPRLLGGRQWRTRRQLIGGTCSEQVGYWAACGCATPPLPGRRRWGARQPGTNAWQGPISCGGSSCCSVLPAAGGTSLGSSRLPGQRSSSDTCWSLPLLLQPGGSRRHLPRPRQLFWPSKRKSGPPGWWPLPFAAGRHMWRAGRAGSRRKNWRGEGHGLAAAVTLASFRHAEMDGLCSHASFIIPPFCRAEPRSSCACWQPRASS